MQQEGVEPVRAFCGLGASILCDCLVWAKLFSSIVSGSNILSVIVSGV